SQWISGEDSRARSHRWRAEADAIAIGIHTARADDPLLTARVEAVARQPRRVIFDSEASLQVDSRLVQTIDEAPVILVCSRAAKRTATSALEAAGVEIVVATGENEGARVLSALDELGSRDVQSLLLEGGPHLAGRFFDAGEFDELRLFVVPILASVRGARLPIECRGVVKIGAAWRALHTEIVLIG